MISMGRRRARTGIATPQENIKQRGVTWKPASSVPRGRQGRAAKLAS